MVNGNGKLTANNEWGRPSPWPRAWRAWPCGPLPLSAWKSAGRASGRTAGAPCPGCPPGHRTCSWEELKERKKESVLIQELIHTLYTKAKMEQNHRNTMRIVNMYVVYVSTEVCMHLCVYVYVCMYVCMSR